MGNLVVYPVPRATYKHSKDDSTLIFIQQKIESTNCETLGCARRKRSTKIPCRYIRSQTPSPYLIMYFHGNSEDIGSYMTQLMSKFSARFMMNVICPEYPTYGIYRGKDDTLTMEEAMIHDARKVIKHCHTNLGFKYENIILVGRSLGTGVVVQLASEFSVKGVVLISAFTSIRDVAKSFVGSVFAMTVPDVFRSVDYIGQVKSPVLFIHGRKDRLISPSMSVELAKKAKVETVVKIGEWMSHNQFRVEPDIFGPIYQFMVEKLGLKKHLTMKYERNFVKDDETNEANETKDESGLFDLSDKQ